MMKISMNEIQEMKKLSRKSILWEYYDEISAMRDKDISFILISLWLEKQGVFTSLQNIRQFYERHKKLGKSPRNKLNPSTKNGGIFSDVQ